MRLKDRIPLSIRRLVGKLSALLHSWVPVRFQLLRKRPIYPGERNRFVYQERYVHFEIQPADRVLDIGSGGDPFPHATILADRFMQKTEHRHAELVRDDRPFVVADVSDLPFRDKCLDFVYCAHILEHVDDPIGSCAEIMRIGKRGFIETPTMGKDMLFAWAKGMHKWHLVSAGCNLCFFEYSPRQLEGIRSSAWQEIIFNKWYYPLQKAFYENQDIFNVMFSWFDSFGVFVFRLDGSVQTLNAEGVCNEPSHS